MDGKILVVSLVRLIGHRLVLHIPQQLMVIM
nr:MAG TPA: hypothetical protein [Crassvirales sp.]